MLIAVSLMFLIPVVFITLTALMTDRQAETTSVMPHPFQWSNFADVFERILCATRSTPRRSPRSRRWASCSPASRSRTPCRG